MHSGFIALPTGLLSGALPHLLPTPDEELITARSALVQSLQDASGGYVNADISTAISKQACFQGQAQERGQQSDCKKL